VPVLGDWVQPGDEEVSTGIVRIGSSTQGTGTVDNANEIAYTVPVTGFPIARIFGSTVQSAAGFFDLTGLVFPPVVPDEVDWPPGAVDIELEAPTGERTDDPIRVAGTARLEIGLSPSGTLHTSYGSEITRYLRAGYDFDGPNPNIPAPVGSSDPDVSTLYAGDVLESFPPAPQPAPLPNEVASTTVPYEFTVDEEDAEGWLAILVRFTSGFSTIAADVGGDGDYIQGTDLSNNEDGPSLPIAYVMYTPPRYRFVFQGGPFPLRQRQRILRGLSVRQGQRTRPVRQDRTW
jgi:hypothetical protein